ncbi:MAG: hypothetical protein Q4C45_04935 [Oscillospiraceae bacterium]|nr:hypothetical protein [Oscillospiraceae bacterium]
MKKTYQRPEAEWMSFRPLEGLMDEPGTSGGLTDNPFLRNSMQDAGNGYSASDEQY